jgi:predicted amidohydrolase YtcJ
MPLRGIADVVLTGGSVFAPGVPAGADAAVALAGSRILAVGPPDRLVELVSPDTRVIEIEGLVVPGFQDAHIHPPWGGLSELRCALYDLSTEAEYLRAIVAYAAEHPDAAWIEGGGWRMPAFPGGIARKESLDQIVPDRPVFLENRDGHGAWVNSRALAIAGIGRDTPDPPDGRIERDEHGEPAGTLHEGAMELVERLVPPPTQAELEEGILRAQRRLHALGITAWQDAWVTEETLPAYRALAERGELTARVVASLWWDRTRGLEQIDELVERRRWGTLGRIDAGTVKIMQDGVCENFTAAMLDPYLTDGGTGISFVEPGLLDQAVARLDGLGFQVHFHAIGDRAVREALDAIEHAGETNGPRDARHHIAHIQVVHPDDVPRFAALGVVANGQPLWACHDPQMDELTIPFLGPERSTHQYPFASLLAAGARLAFGSDWTVSSANPLLEMEVAVTRVAPEARDAGPFLPEQRISLTDAITAFTAGSAFVNRLDETGTIAPGKIADLAVLDRDPFAPGAGPIGDAKVVLTIVDGQVVFDVGAN